MKRVISLILMVVLVFALSADFSEGQETQVRMDIEDSYVFSVTPVVSLNEGSGSLQITFTEYHSNNVVPVTIRSNMNPDNTTWKMTGEDPNSVIRYSIFDNGDSPITPNSSFNVYPSIGIALRLEVNDADRRTAKIGSYFDNLVFTVG